jgi:hypothetical protein
MDKQLLRLGTKNLRRLKAWLALFEEALTRTSPGDVSSPP